MIVLYSVNIDSPAVQHRNAMTDRSRHLRYVWAKSFSLVGINIMLDLIKHMDIFGEWALFLRICHVTMVLGTV